MRILSPVVQIAALLVFGLWQYIVFGLPIDIQLVGDEDARLILQAPRQALHEMFGGCAIATALRQNIE